MLKRNKLVQSSDALRQAGKVAMMIFGLSCLFVPSFAHAFLHSLKLAKLQFWLINFGVAGLTVSFSGLLPYSEYLQCFVVGSLITPICHLSVEMSVTNVTLGRVASILNPQRGTPCAGTSEQLLR